MGDGGGCQKTYLARVTVRAMRRMPNSATNDRGDTDGEVVCVR
jgi:hypothetical protein